MDAFTRQNSLTRRANQRQDSIIALWPASATIKLLLHIRSGESPSPLIVESAALSREAAEYQLSIPWSNARPTVGHVWQKVHRRLLVRRRCNPLGMPSNIGPNICHRSPVKRIICTCSLGKKSVEAVFIRMPGIKLPISKSRLATTFIPSSPATLSTHPFHTPP